MSEPCPDLLRRLATARGIPFRERASHKRRG